MDGQRPRAVVVVYMRPWVVIFASLIINLSALRKVIGIFIVSCGRLWARGLRLGFAVCVFILESGGVIDLGRARVTGSGNYLHRLKGIDSPVAFFGFCRCRNAPTNNGRSVSP